jgi:hypothetical protein
VTALKADRELDALDELVNRFVPRKALSMRTNKLLFNHVLLISERDQWRAGVARLHQAAAAPLDESFLEQFRAPPWAASASRCDPAGSRRCCTSTRTARPRRRRPGSGASARCAAG